MTKALKNLLILLLLSVITVSAQDLVPDTDCSAQLNTCYEQCNENDDICMDKCDLTLPCIELEEEEETPSEL